MRVGKREKYWNYVQYLVPAYGPPQKETENCVKRNETGCANFSSQLPCCESGNLEHAEDESFFLRLLAKPSAYQQPL